MITVIGNLKGGTGKSTVAFNLALWLKIKQGGVTLFDLDPQKTLSDVVDIREEEGYEPDLEVFDDDVRLCREIAHDFLTLGACEIDRNGLLVAICAQAVGRIRSVLAVGAFDIGWAPAACVVTDTRAFHLDDLRAHVSEHLCRPWSGEYSRQI